MSDAGGGPLPDAEPTEGGAPGATEGGAPGAAWFGHRSGYLGGTLFGDPEAEWERGSRRDVGYRGPTACNAAGITYRQLDYWARTGLVAPSVREAAGRGTQRLYSFRDIVLLKIVKQLLDAAIPLGTIRTVIATLKDRDFTELKRITILSDGSNVYECTDTDDAVALLQSGQSVFAIAIERNARDVATTLASLPGERSVDLEADPTSPYATGLPRDASIPLREEASVARHRALLERVNADLAQRRSKHSEQDAS